MSEPDSIRPGAVPGAWRCVALVGTMQLLSMLDRNILAILNPRIKADLHIGDAEMGLLYGTVFALFYALFSLPLGRLADGWRRGLLLAICIAFWSLSTGLAAFAGSFALLALSRLGVGVGEAASQPAGTSLLFDVVPRRRRGLAMAVFAAMLAAGLGLSSVVGGLAASWWDARFPVPALAPMGFSGWQFAFLVAALPGLPVAWLLARMPEPRRGLMDGIETPPDPAPFAATGAVLAAVLPVGIWITLARARASWRQWGMNLGALAGIVLAMALLARWCRGLAPRPPLLLSGTAIDPHGLQWAIVGIGLYCILNLIQSLRFADPPAFAVITRSRALWLCMGAGALQTTINYGIMAFTPAFLMKSYQLSAVEVGVQFGLLATVLGIVGPLVSGPASDWLDSRWPGAGRVWLVVLSLGLSPLIALTVYTAPGPGAFYLRFVAYSLVLTMWLPSLYAVMYEQVLPRMRARTSALYLIVLTILGLGIGPYTVGLIADANHGDLGWAILAINWLSPLILLLLVLLAPRAERDRAMVAERARAAGEAI